jgi:hypothetical protein
MIPKLPLSEIDSNMHVRQSQSCMPMALFHNRKAIIWDAPRIEHEGEA